MSGRIFRLLAVLAIALQALAGCARSRDPRANEPQLFEGMGTHTRPIRSSSPEAQRFFDQGLTWAYAFNHDEAIRSFQRAAELDPQNPMPWWGIALCHGPHINNPVRNPENSKAAWAAIIEAKSRILQANPVDRELILALEHRYTDPEPTDPRPLDEAYADAMARVWEANPSDADVGALYAEAMMDLQPWDLWERDGRAKGNAQKIVSTLEAVLRSHPNHPGATHLYIHAVEASKEPGRAIAAADTLRMLVPAAGHLVHMPSHIDVRVGRWADAATANEQAIRADANYRARSPGQGFYRIYMLHNQHFLAFTAMMEGRREVALTAARMMVASVPEEFLKSNAALADPLLSIVLDVQKRFGMWDDLLREPEPDTRLPITRAMWRANRTIAMAAKGDLASARRERELFERAKGEIPQGAMMTINSAEKIMEIATKLVDAEVDWRAGERERAVQLLRQAAAIEDTLTYMEPPDWLQPIRHTLGAFLLEMNRATEAERVYREDLAHWPENAWSLLGLEQALTTQGTSPDAENIATRRQKAWARATIRPQATCLCVEK